MQIISCIGTKEKTPFTVLHFVWYVKAVGGSDCQLHNLEPFNDLASCTGGIKRKRKHCGDI